MAYPAAMHRLLVLAISMLLAHAPALAHAAAAVADLCAPCSDGEQCISNYCALDSNNNGICTEPCQSNADCPPAFACTTATGVCTPTTAASCPTNYTAPVNIVCQFPATTSGGAQLTRNCAAGLICYTNFPADASGTSIGVCVEACSTTAGGPTCPFGTTCCFGTGSDGSCTTSSTTATFGGCFDIGDAGDACTDNNKVYCRPGTTCTDTTSPTAKFCYDTCDQGICYRGNVCRSVDSLNLCCDSSKYVDGSPSSCVPGPSLCRRQVGVACSTNDDCREGLCYKSSGSAACTRPCTTNADCTAASTDANGDGVADGGTTCQTFGTSQYCWPTGAPAAPPACASAVLDTSAITNGGGCHCRAQPGGSLVGVGVAALLIVRRWRRTFR